jgi:hypothetical protein
MFLDSFRSYFGSDFRHLNCLINRKGSYLRFNTGESENSEDKDPFLAYYLVHYYRKKCARKYLSIRWMDKARRQSKRPGALGLEVDAAGERDARLVMPGACT